MRNVKIPDTPGPSWAVAEWNDLDDLLKQLDWQLEKYGLEIVSGDTGSSCVAMKIAKRRRK